MWQDANIVELIKLWGDWRQHNIKNERFDKTQWGKRKWIKGNVDLIVSHTMKEIVVYWSRKILQIYRYLRR